MADPSGWLLCELLSAPRAACPSFPWCALPWSRRYAGLPVRVCAPLDVLGAPALRGLLCCGFPVSTRRTPLVTLSAKSSLSLHGLLPGPVVLACALGSSGRASAAAISLLHAAPSKARSRSLVEAIVRRVFLLSRDESLLEQILPLVSKVIFPLLHRDELSRRHRLLAWQTPLGARILRRPGCLSS